MLINIFILQNMPGALTMIVAVISYKSNHFTSTTHLINVLPNLFSESCTASATLPSSVVKNLSIFYHCISYCKHDLG